MAAATLQRRLDVLEAAARAVQESEWRAAIDDFNAWLAAHASEAERAAWDRYLLNRPVTDAQLAGIGITRAESDAIHAEVGALTADDQIAVDALLARVPPDLIERLERCE